MKISPCLIGITLLISSIYMSYMKKDNYIFKEFIDTLDPEQMIIYSDIVFERLLIYILGALVLSKASTISGTSKLGSKDV